MPHDLSSDDERQSAVEDDPQEVEEEQETEVGNEENEFVDVDGFAEVKKGRVSEALLAIEDLDSDEEIWAVTVPSHLNIDSLHDQQMIFKKETKTLLQSGGRQYEASVSKKKSSLNLLLPNKKGKIKAVSVECRGEIHLREAVAVTKVGPILVMPHENVRPAGEIKPRHPFFVHGDTIQKASVQVKKVSSSQKRKSKATDDEQFDIKTELTSPKKRRSKM